MPSVAVVGAGGGGIAMGRGLRSIGIRRFTIFEQSTGLGGTWLDNVYPGAAVDTPVPFYSFSFHPHDFSRTHIKQPELLAYLRNAAERFGLQSHFRFGTAVTRVAWDDANHCYEVSTSDGATERFDVVVTAVGILNHPKYPDWPGLDRFTGAKFHSSRWDHTVDLTGKTVAVVGTGSTGAQIVPAIAERAKKVYVFQRQPGWVLPKDDREFSSAERARLLRPVHRRWLRLRQGWVYETGRLAVWHGTSRNRKAEEACREYIESVFADRPDLAKLVTPQYPFGGKRVVRDRDFYPALLRDNVELIPRAVASVTETAIVDDTGSEHAIDVLVMCTGFQPANFLATLEVIGRDGRSIHDTWAGDAEAFLGLTVAGFPNFYMLYGPNTNGAPVMFLHERQVAFVVANLRRMIRTGVTSIEVRDSVMRRYNQVLQRRLARSVAVRNPDVHNYSRSASGRDVVGWVDGMVIYAFLTRVSPRLSSFARMRVRPDEPLPSGLENRIEPSSCRSSGDQSGK